MKKYMTMPDVKIVRFDTNDIIVTSGEVSLNLEEQGTGADRVQGRNSLWD